MEVLLRSVTHYWMRIHIDVPEHITVLIAQSCIFIGKSTFTFRPFGSTLAYCGRDIFIKGSNSQVKMIIYLYGLENSIENWLGSTFWEFFFVYAEQTIENSISKPIAFRTSPKYINSWSRLAFVKRFSFTTFRKRSKPSNLDHYFPELLK